MKKNATLLLCFSILFFGSKTNAQQSSKKQAKIWFAKKEWLGGADLKPNKSINKTELLRQYQLNKVFWDEAVAFLKGHDLDSLPKGKYNIDGDNVVASVTRDSTKNYDKTNWESHRKYIDIQCIISGEEKMGIWPVAAATVTQEYDEKRDIAHYTAKGKFYIGVPGDFFIFFPSDAHRPNITPGGNKVEKKIVIKVRAAN
jgi:biofilm protein TabA